MTTDLRTANAASERAEQATSATLTDPSAAAHEAARRAHNDAVMAWAQALEEEPDIPEDEANQTVEHHEWLEVHHAVDAAKLVGSPEAWALAWNTAREAADNSSEPDDIETYHALIRLATQQEERARWVRWLKGGPFPLVDQRVVLEPVTPSLYHST